MIIEEACPESKCTKFYVTTYCNFAHCRACGAAMNVDHAECWVDPRAIKAERRGNYAKAISILKGLI